MINPSCDSKYIVQTLSAIKKEKDKVDYIEDRLNVCGVQSPTARKKRKMNGYNCYIRVCTKKTGDFKGCLTARGWSQFDQEQKDSFKRHADNGCPSYLWEE